MAEQFGTKRQRESEIGNRETEANSRSFGASSPSQTSPEYTGKSNPPSFGSQSRSVSSGKSQHADGGGARHDRIARRAYELFELRGREPGHELEDWLRAEREIAR